mgnify:CR=1 FL=1
MGWPRWAPDGRELFFVDNASTLRASPVETDGTGRLRFGTPAVLFSTTFSSEGRAVAVAPDGRSFVVNHRGAAMLEPLRLVQRWGR